MRRGAQQHRSGVYGIGRMEHGRDGELAAHALTILNFSGLLVKSVEPNIENFIIWAPEQMDDWIGYTSNYFLSFVGFMMSISLCLQKLIDAVYKIQVLQ
jgi:aminopeptidase-like protein